MIKLIKISLVVTFFVIANLIFTSDHPLLLTFGFTFAGAIGIIFTFIYVFIDVMEYHFKEKSRIKK